MITNEKQYRSTRSILEELRKTLLAVGASDTTSPFKEEHKAALESQIDELAEDVEEYENLRAGGIKTFEAEGLDDLPGILIRARIARGMNQKDLGDFLGLKEQQIQRYEADRYRTASLERLIEIAQALNVKISKRVELIGDSQMSTFDMGDWRAFPFAEMFKRGWFEDFEGNLNDARKSADSLLPEFFRNANTNRLAPAFHRRSVRTTGQIHEAALAAWEARVATLADRLRPEIAFNRSRIDASWISDLVGLSTLADGLHRAIGHLRSIGLVLIIEPHLPGTLLDGAALRSGGNTSVIGLTLRHDRLDNFWFTLLHEVAHHALHIDEEVTAIFDDVESPARDKVEADADTFAQEALLPSKVWHTCMSRFTRTEKAVLADANRFGINPAIIAGRIRREANNYTLLKNLVGAGEPRRQLGLEPYSGLSA